MSLSNFKQIGITTTERANTGPRGTGAGATVISPGFKANVSASVELFPGALHADILASERLRRLQLVETAGDDIDIVALAPHHIRASVPAIHAIDLGLSPGYRATSRELDPSVTMERFFVAALALLGKKLGVETPEKPCSTVQDTVFPQGGYLGLVEKLGQLECTVREQGKKIEAAEKANAELGKTISSVAAALNVVAGKLDVFADYVDTEAFGEKQAWDDVKSSVADATKIVTPPPAGK